MSTLAAESRQLERQVAYARPISLILALVGLLEAGPLTGQHGSVIFLGVYLAVAALGALARSLGHGESLQFPPEADLMALAIYFFFTPPVMSLMFLYLFVCFAGSVFWGLRRTVVLSGAVTLALLVRVALRGHLQWGALMTWPALALGTFSAGVGLGFLAERQRRHSWENEFLSQLHGLMDVEKGLAESIRLVLDRLAATFDAERGILIFADVELERLFVWAVRRGETDRIVPESFPREKSDAFLFDAPDATLCWNSLEGAGEGFGWNRRDARALEELPRVPGPSRRELNIRSVAAATFEFGGHPAGRILLLNFTHHFTPFELRWLERIVASLGAPLENLFLLRHLRARAIEAERGRISHDLHDGILQTLLSMVIQLDVLRRKLPPAEQMAQELETLKQTLRRENEELRRLVTDLRPLRVGQADLLDLMRGYSERFRTESKIDIDLIIDILDLRASDRVCREVFQIYREALSNVKKHARSSHVVVKLWQDEATISLVVDDNGQGFSFAGRFSSEELDRLRIGPISIKERTRGVGGALTIESNPGHGARITVAVPIT